MVQLWLLLALAYAFGHALVSVFDKLILKNKSIEPMSLSTFRLGTNALFSLIIVLVLFGFALPAASFWASLTVVSVVYTLAVLFYFIPLKFGDVSQLVPFREAIATVLSFLLAIVLISEITTVLDLIGTLLIMSGTYVLLTGGKIIIPRLSKPLLLTGLSGVAIAVFSVMFKPLVLLTHPALANFYLYVFVFIMLFAVNTATNSKRQLKTFKVIIGERKVLLLSLAASLSAALGTLALFYGLSIGNAVEVLPVARVLPIFATLIGWIALKEQAGLPRLIGAIITFGGIYFISI